MHRCEHQYHVKCQKDGAAKQTATLMPPVIEQPEVMNTEPEEESNNKENDDPQRAASVAQQVLAVMEQTILSQQEY